MAVNNEPSDTVSIASIAVVAETLGLMISSSTTWPGASLGVTTTLIFRLSA